jgi:hypothetical protein
MRSDLEEQRRITDELRATNTGLNNLLTEKNDLLIRLRHDNQTLKRQVFGCRCGAYDRLEKERIRSNEFGDDESMQEE